MKQPPSNRNIIFQAPKQLGTFHVIFDRKPALGLVAVALSFQATIRSMSTRTSRHLGGLAHSSSVHFLNFTLGKTHGKHHVGNVPSFWSSNTAGVLNSNFWKKRVSSNQHITPQQTHMLDRRQVYSDASCFNAHDKSNEVLYTWVLLKIGGTPDHPSRLNMIDMYMSTYIYIYVYIIYNIIHI